MTGIDGDNRALIKSQFGANAANYSTSRVHAKGASLGRLVDLVAPKADWAVLDVATGAGHTAFAFAPHVASVVASDITPEMLGETAKNAATRGLSNVTTAIADAEAMPFDDGVFDLVTCRIAPHHFPDVAQFLAEVRRVMRPGGTFALVDNVAPDALLLPGFGNGDLRDADRTYNAFEKVRDPSHGRALTTSEWLDLMADVGFALGHHEHQKKTMHFNGWCQTMAVDAPTKMHLTGMLRDAKPALTAFLVPRNDTVDGMPDITFDLTELIVIGQTIA